MNKRPLLGLVALGLLLLLGCVAWMLMRTAPDGAKLGDAPAHVPGANDTGASALEAQPALLGALDSTAARMRAVPVGVRLPGPGLLSGRVIDRETGLGVPGVRVDLMPVPPAAGNFLGRMLRMSSQTRYMANRVKPVAVAETDAHGAFRFDGVRIGTWFLDARGPYHVPETTIRARVLASGAGGPLDVFVLGGGRVLGKVFTPTGEVATHAKVVLVPGPGNFISSMQTGDMRQLECDTDAQGAFSFDGVPPGEGWEVTATGTDFALSHATDLRVLAGQDTLVDIHTRLGGKIAGRVFSVPGKDGVGDPSKSGPEKDEPKPLAEAHLGAIPRGLRSLRCAEEIMERTHCVSAADGSYTMENVPPGEIDIVAIAFGHLPAVGARVTSLDATLTSSPDILLPRGPVVYGKVTDAAGEPLEGVQMSWNLVDWKNFQFDFSFAPMMAEGIKGIELPRTDAQGRFWAGPIAGDTPWKVDFKKLGYVDAQLKFDPEKDGAPEKSDVTVVMHKGGAVEGVVMDELAAEPVPVFTITSGERVDVEADAPGGQNPFTGGLTFEDENGRFRLDSLKPGKVSLTFSSPGYPDTTVDDVEVTESSVKKGLIVKLRPGATIKGVVASQDGKPVPGAQVIVLPSDGKLRPPPGMRGADQNRRRGRGGMRGPFGGGGNGPFGAGDQFPPGILGFAANLGMLGDKAVVSRADGSFELRGVESGSVRVQAFQRDYAWGTSSAVEVVEGRTQEGVLVTMHEGGGLEGKVTDRHDRPLAQSIVIAFSPSAFAGNGVSNAGGLYQGETNAKGDYEIRHIAAGSYFVVVTRGDEELNPLSFFGTLNFDLVTVPEDEVIRYDLVDQAAGGCRVYGTVSDQGKPVTRGMLAAFRFDGESILGVEMKAARIDTQGRFEFAGLAPGDYQLNLDGTGAGGQVRLVLEVPDAPELQVSLELPHGAIEGVVIDDTNNAPVKNAEVLLSSTDAPEAEGLFGSMIARDGRSQRKTTNEKGEYRFERLRSAEYELVARGPRDGELKGNYAPSEPRRIKADERRTERGVDVRLLPALTLKGVVKDAQGAPVPGANVLVTQEGGASNFVERAKSGDDGHYEVRGLAPGKFSVSVSSKEFADFEKKGVKIERLAGKDNELDLVLQKGVLVKVRVVDSAHRPVAGAHAQLRPKGAKNSNAASTEKALTGFFSGEGNSGDDGRIEMGRFNPGEYQLEAQRGFAKASKDSVKVEGGREETELEIELP